MRSLFPGYFRPTTAEFASLWDSCYFSVDANVLLNLYRYSQGTRVALEKALGGVKERLFLPNQAAKEFLRNRVGVTLSQAEEYTKATKLIRELRETLSNSKRHPFIPDDELKKFSDISDEICAQLDAQRDTLVARLSDDEVLGFLEATFDGRVGSPLDSQAMSALAKEGDDRYNKAIPPGYRDAKKEESGDPHRKYGDLILWKQLINFAKEKSADVIFVTDDKKDDWWLKHSGRTIGPRPELIEEFAKDTGKKLWMYSVDKFVEQAAKTSNSIVSEEVIAEIIETRNESSSEIESSPSENKYLNDELHRVLAVTPKPMSLGDEFLRALEANSKPMHLSDEFRQTLEKLSKPLYLSDEFRQALEKLSKPVELNDGIRRALEAASKPAQELRRAMDELPSEQLRRAFDALSKTKGGL